VTEDLLGKTEEDLLQMAGACGDRRAYRVKQLREWLYRRDAGAFGEMTNLPQAFRTQLEHRARIGRAAVLSHLRSVDGTQKFLFGFRDGKSVETVILKHPNRHTGCISTQVGCAMGCTFCATAIGGLRRNLTAGEIVEQVLAAQRHGGVKLTNLVFMGMGEPLANYENLLHSVEILNAAWGLQFGNRQMTVSTAGLAPAILRLAKDRPPFNLALSLHATTDELRSKLMPINKVFPLETLLPACAEYAKATERQVTFEFLLLGGVNDSPEEAKRLAKIAKRIPSKLNLIAYNPVPGLPYERPAPARVARFKAAIEAEGVFVRVRETRGGDIAAACGQLLVKVQGASLQGGEASATK